MPRKGTLLPRKVQHPFKLTALRGSALAMQMKKKWISDHPGQRFGWAKLADDLSQLSQKSEVSFNATYLVALNARDNRPTVEKAAVMAAYLSISIAEIDTSNYGAQTEERTKCRTEKPPKAALEIEEKPSHQLLALIFISQNKNVNTQKYGVGYVQ